MKNKQKIGIDYIVINNESETSHYFFTRLMVMTVG
jgi:hypothetical protein